MRIVTFYDEVKRNNELAFARALDECVGDAKRRAPVRVGLLRGSIHSEMLGRMRARFGSQLRYAWMRERGGTIVPVRARMLSWIDPITGRRVFAKKVVQRPGGPRQGYQPYIKPAGDQFPKFMLEHLQALG